MAPVQTSQEWVEVSHDPGIDIRLAQLFVEVSHTEGDAILLVQEFAELSHSLPADPDPPAPVATDTIDTVTYPTLEQSGDPPEWVLQRGQDVRVYDDNVGRLVWGPQHPFLNPSDCWLENGLIRCQFGAQGAIPRIDVFAFKDGEWRDLGDVIFTDPAFTERTLNRVRIQTLTPERGVVVMEVREVGPIVVELRRGERMFRITDGQTIEPAASRTRQVRWDTVSSGGVSNGRVVAAATAQGLIRGVCALDDDVTQAGTDTGLQRVAQIFEAGVFVATAGTKDAAADHHNQFTGDSEQEVRLR